MKSASRYLTNKSHSIYSHLLKCIRTAKFQPQHVIQAVFHECRICGIYILCDKERIIQHLFGKHAVNQRKYETLPSFEKGKYMQVISHTELNKTSNLKSLYNVPLVPPLERASNPKGSLPDSLTTYHVGNLCLFACDICDFKCESFGHLKYHLSKCNNHGSLKFQFNKKYIKEARYHKCKICEKVLLCDISAISLHVRPRHGYTVGAYKDFSKEKNRKAKNVSEPGKMIKETPLLRYQCESYPVTKSEERKIPNSSITKRYLNLCVFQCDKCKAELSSWDHMRIHLRSCKGIMEFDKCYVVKAIIHECKLCERRMLCDKYAITQHIYKAHKLSGAAYAKINEKKQQPIFKNKEVKLVDKKLLVSVCTFPGSLSKSFGCSLAPQELITDSEMTDVVGNLCTFKCFNCQLETCSWTKMSHHAMNECPVIYKKSAFSWFHRDFFT